MQDLVSFGLSKFSRSTLLFCGSFVLASAVHAEVLELQAEDFNNYDGVVESNHEGYTGSGFVNTYNEYGSAVRWTFSMPTAATSTISVRYANGAADRAVDIYLNQNLVVSNFNMTSTGAWTNWASVDLLVADLPVGATIVSIESVNPNGTPNIDKIEITYDEPQAVQFVWPVSGQQSQDWIVDRYVDIDPSAGASDYTGGSLTVDGYTVTDIDIGSFRDMDNGSAQVLAVADGVVLNAIDGGYDRNTISTSWADNNHIEILHDNGLVTRYFHLKNGSISVVQGQEVVAGQQIGVVGSSGDSERPHLGFQVSDTFTGAIQCPFNENLWLSAPTYAPAAGVMDMVVQTGPISSNIEIIDPLDNISEIDQGEQLGVGISVGGGGTSSAVQLALLSPSGNQYAISPNNNSQLLNPGHSFWFATFDVDESAPLGLWRANVLVDGQTIEEYWFWVRQGAVEPYWYEAEDQTWANATVDTNHAGYTGWGFVNTENVLGTWVEITVDLAEGGTYEFSATYANGATADRPQQVLVNGVNRTGMSFGSTGSWTNWSSQSVFMDLAAGVSTIRLVSLHSSGAPNLDHFTLTKQCLTNLCN